VDVFGDEARNLGGRISHNIEESDNVGTAGQILKNLDLSLDFLLLHGLEDFDDTFILGDDVDSFEDLAKKIGIQNRPPS